MFVNYRNLKKTNTDNMGLGDFNPTGNAIVTPVLVRWQTVGHITTVYYTLKG